MSSTLTTLAVRRRFLRRRCGGRRQILRTLRSPASKTPETPARLVEFAWHTTQGEETSARESADHHWYRRRPKRHFPNTLHVHSKLRRWLQLQGWLNWLLNVFSLLKRASTSYTTKRPENMCPTAASTPTRHPTPAPGPFHDSSQKRTP